MRYYLVINMVRVDDYWSESSARAAFLDACRNCNFEEDSVELREVGGLVIALY